MLMAAVEYLEIAKERMNDIFCIGKDSGDVGASIHQYQYKIDPLHSSLSYYKKSKVNDF